MHYENYSEYVNRAHGLPPSKAPTSSELPRNSLFFIKEDGSLIDKTQSGIEPSRETIAAVNFTYKVLHAALHLKRQGKHDPQTPESVKGPAEIFLKANPQAGEKALEKLRNDYMEQFNLSGLALLIAKNESGGSVHEQINKLIEIYPPLKRDIEKMETGDMLKISRRTVNQYSKEPILEKSVTIRKTETAFKVLTRVHPAPGKATQPDTPKKYIAKGGQTVIKRLETSDKGTEVLRKYTGRPNPNAAIKRDKTIRALKAAKVPHVHIPLAIAKGPGRGKLLKAEEGEIATYYTGGDLANKLEFSSPKNKSKNSLPPPLVLKAIDNITESLSMLHGLGIAHLDLKPDNILVGKDDFKLHDFETSVHVDNPTQIDPSDTQNEVNTLLSFQGTLGYMAPELIANTWQVTEESLAKAAVPLKIRYQFEKEIAALNTKGDTEELRKKAREIYSKADSYSLSVLIFVLMTGKMPVFAWKHSLPFNKFTEANSTMQDIWGNEEGIRKELSEFLKAMEPTYDRKLLDLVVRGLSPDPAQRPSMHEYRHLFQKDEESNK